MTTCFHLRCIVSPRHSQSHSPKQCSIPPIKYQVSSSTFAEVLSTYLLYLLLDGEIWRNIHCLWKHHWRCSGTPANLLHLHFKAPTIQLPALWCFSSTAREPREEAGRGALMMTPETEEVQLMHPDLLAVSGPLVGSSATRSLRHPIQSRPVGPRQLNDILVSLIVHGNIQYIYRVHMLSFTQSDALAATFPGTAAKKPLLAVVTKGKRLPLEKHSISKQPL